jgi:hypothetical protein
MSYVLCLTYKVSGLFVALMAALASYTSALSAVDLELTYGSQKTQVGDFYLTEGTMDVTYAQAETGCYRATGQLFYVTEEMDLNKLFEEKEVQSVWTGVYKNMINPTGFLDTTDMYPLSKTEYTRVGTSQLKTESFTDDMAVILQKNGSEFEYVPVQKSSQNRALCMIKIKFPRKKSTLKILSSFQKDFVKQLTEVERVVSISARIANSTILVLPELPTNFMLNNAKQVSLEDAINRKIRDFTSEATKVVTSFQNMKEAEQISQLIFQHETAMSFLQELEGEIVAPIFKPLAFLDEPNQKELRAGSSMQFFAIGEEKLVFQIEPPVHDLAVTSTTPIPTSPTVQTSTTTSTVPSTRKSTSTMKSTESWFNFDDVFGNSGNESTVPSTTTTTSTTTTQTTTSSLRRFNTTTLRPATATPKDTWFQWFAQQVIQAYDVAEYIKLSWRFPTIYDIMLAITSFFHSISLFALCFCCQRKRGLEIRKMTLPSIIRKRKRESSTDSDVESQNEVPEPPVLPTPQIVMKRRPSIKKVQIEEVEYNREEHVPLRRIIKRSAPPPPSAPYMEQETSFYGNRDTGTVPKKQMKGYLRTSIPVYLMESDLSLNG